MDISSLLSPDSQDSSPPRGGSTVSQAGQTNHGLASPSGPPRPVAHPRKSSSLSNELHLDTRYSSPRTFVQGQRQLQPTGSSAQSTSSPSTPHATPTAGGQNRVARSPRTYLDKRPRLQSTSSPATSASQSMDSSRSSTSGMDALAEVASRQRPQSVTSPSASNYRHQPQQHRPQPRHDRSSSNSSGSFAPSGKASVPRSTSVVTTPVSAPTTVDSLMPDAPAPQHAHIASSLSNAESRRLAELQAAITANTFDFRSHLEYLSLLHTGFARHVESGRSLASNYELLDTLRQARLATDKIFPVGESLWVDWLTDENILAKSIDDRVALMELHRRAVLEEPSSAQLWLLYGDYLYYLWSSCSRDDDGNNGGEDEDGLGYGSTGWTMEDKVIGREVFEWDSMIDVWEQGVARTQWHLNDSNLVWDRYLDILMTDLKHNKTDEKLLSIRDKFVDRLTNRAHATWDQTRSAYSNFISTYYDSEKYEDEMVSITKSSARAKRVFELRANYEFRIQQAVERMDKDAEWTQYAEYLDWELRKKGPFSKDLINGLYERATIRFATDASLWNDYVEFLIESAPLSMHSPTASGTNNGPNDDEALPSLDGVLERSTRHCPWSGDLWSHRLLAMEADGCTFQEIEEVKHKATSSGLLETRDIEDLMKVYVAWAGYLSRRAFSPDASEDDLDMAEIGISSSLEHVHKVVADVAKREGTSANKAKGDPQYRLERIHIKFLFKRNDQDAMRRIWHELSNRPGVADTYDFWNRYYIWALIIYERNRHVDNIDESREENSHNNPNPNQPWREGTQVLERALARVETLDWPEQAVQMYVNHCEQHETVLEYRKSKIVARRAFKLVAERRENEAASWKAQQEQQAAHAHAEAEAQSQTKEESSSKRKRESNDSLVGNKKTKQDRVVAPMDVKMADTEAKELADTEPKRDREHTVILVKNLPGTATQFDLRRFFRECGKIISLNLDEETSSGTKTATVEFESKEDALYAQTKAAKPFDGQTIEIEFSNGSVLWVANYPPAADEKYIRGLFTQYGEILQVRFPSIKLNTSRRFCYVQFSSPLDAKAASDAMDGTVLDNKFHLQAKISDPSLKQERSGALHDGREIIIKNLDWSATEDDLKQLILEAVSIKSSDAVEKIRIPRTLDGKSKGSAFVSLSSQELVDEAIQKLNNTPFRRRTIHVEKAIDRGKRMVGRIVRAGTDDISERAASTPATDNGDDKDGDTSAQAANARLRTIALLGVSDTVNAARLEAFITASAKDVEIRKLTLRTDHAGAIVEFANKDGAGVAGMALEGVELDGQKLQVGTVSQLLNQAPVEKARAGFGKKKAAFGGGHVARPKGNAGPKKRLGAARPTLKKGNEDKMEVDGQNINGEAEEKKKSNDEFREMFLKGKKSD